jgi:type 1 fimbriae regulatory protein FimB
MRPKGTKKNGIKFLDEEELKEFSKAVKKGGLRDFVMFGLVLRLGLRVQELVNILLTDINQETAQITIRGIKSGKTRHYALMDGNGYRPDRENELWRKLKLWMRKERNEIDPQERNPYLFPSKLYADRPVGIDLPKTAFKKYAMKAGLAEDFSIHSLRHTTAIQLVRNNWSGVRIMGWLRHRSIQSTQIYFEALQMKEDDVEANNIFSSSL